MGFSLIKHIFILLIVTTCLHHVVYRTSYIKLQYFALNNRTKRLKFIQKIAFSLKKCELRFILTTQHN